MSFNLVIDRGNHSTKFYLFSEGKIAGMLTSGEHLLDDLMDFTKETSINASILSSVVAMNDDLRSALIQMGPLVELSSSTAIPLKINYATPGSLGPDRIAAATGGWQLFDKEPVLVIVAGTCITYNMVEADGTFTGGAISPGLHMRLKAMHEFTGKLPLVELNGPHPLLGNSTELSIRSGAVNGTVEEIKGMITSYSNAYPSLKTVISGGDGAFLAEALKNGIFARPELVAEGLNTILNYNVADHLAR